MVGWGLRVAAGLAGLVGGGMTVAFVESLNAVWHPMPAGLDPAQTDAFAAWAATLPVSALATVVVAWFLGGVVSAGVSMAIVRAQTAGPAWALCAVFSLATLMNLAAFPHPAWMWVVGLAAFPAGSALGIAGVRRAVAASAVARDRPAPGSR